MRIYDFNDYKRFLNEFIANLPRKGRGQSIALATHLNVQQSVITAILKHDRHFTAEQGLAAASFFGFDGTATEFFVLMIQAQRADSKDLKIFWKAKLDQIRDAQMKLANAAPEAKEISESEKGIYYSNWYYSAARVALSIPKYRSIDALSTFLGLSRSKTARIIEFFERTKIIKSDGSMMLTSIGTWVRPDSELVNMHRRNWRVKAQEKFGEGDEKSYFLSMPMAMTAKDSDWFQKEIRNVVNELIKRLEADSSEPAEVTRCLNIDWFRF